MLHLRVICPPERTGVVQAELVAEPGATHITVQPGIALAPAGDVVEADVTREAADQVLATLRDLGIDRSGGITLETIDTTLSEAADAAEKAVPGDPADAVVWEELITRTGEESRLTVTFQVFLTIACVLAAIGAITDSPVTVVGAMVLGPEFGALAAVAVGLVLRRRDLIHHGALALAAGFPVAMIITALATIAFDAIGLLPTGSLDQMDQVKFIYTVGPFSLIVALLAGSAGMLALTSARSAILVGVFISVTTVPSAAYTSVALIEQRFDEAWQAALQLVVNVLGIVVAAVAVLLLSPRARAWRGSGKRRVAG
ncbi:DUF389 domain-containing protein [Pseudonocardia asaccharolytica]|uniref:Membrane protein n=1 Tax=Pseudonocardia asaccharolytica DSM 44247 = NBRC 16224 TaxID=1123024 RepID=A0A511D2M7_9PSEU|nr:DUF389 domain-containing protein [Pseudonocardia asaccharolytica]GEL19045.1 membrane protein [Pseudonocardia asaccharolytica DSM 44247 = NBRC 16224]